MSVWDSITTIFRSQAQHLEYVMLDPQQVSPAPADTAAVAAGDGYFRLWAEQMFLKMDRDWFQTWYPVVQSVTTFRFGSPAADVELAQVAGPDRLRDVDQAHLDRVVTLQLPLTPLVPFNGGTVQIEAGLMKMQASDMVQRFLSVVGGFSSLVAVPQLSTALNVASAVSKGVEQLLGVSGNQMALGYQQTFVSAGGGGSNDLRPCYIAIINAAGGTYPAAQLWVKDGNLLTGASQAGAQPLAGVDYMLLRIETRKARDDWKSLSSINDPYMQAMDALDQVDDSGNPRVADADVFIRSAVVAVRHSPDLTDTDRNQVMRAIRDAYQAQKATVLGNVGAKGLTAPAPTLDDVAATAHRQDAGPVAVGDLFP